MHNIHASVLLRWSESRTNLINSHINCLRVSVSSHHSHRGYCFNLAYEHRLRIYTLIVNTSSQWRTSHTGPLSRSNIQLKNYSILEQSFPFATITKPFEKRWITVCHYHCWLLDYVCQNGHKQFLIYNRGYYCVSAPLYMVYGRLFNFPYICVHEKVPVSN